MAVCASDDASALLGELRRFFACPAWSPAASDEAARRQLDEALPLLMMMVARLRREVTEESLAEVRHNWHKALRRRGWHALPALAADGARAVSEAPTASAAVGDVGAVMRELSSFLALFGLPLTLGRADVARLTGLPELLAELAPAAQRLFHGSLLPPVAYAAAYRAIVTPWNRMVGEGALHLPQD